MFILGGTSIPHLKKRPCSKCFKMVSSKCVPLQPWITSGSHKNHRSVSRNLMKSPHLWLIGWSYLQMNYQVYLLLRLVPVHIHLIAKNIREYQVCRIFPVLFTPCMCVCVWLCVCVCWEHLHPTLPGEACCSCRQHLIKSMGYSLRSPGHLHKLLLGRNLRNETT